MNCCVVKGSASSSLFSIFLSLVFLWVCSLVMPLTCVWFVTSPCCLCLQLFVAVFRHYIACCFLLTPHMALCCGVWFSQLCLSVFLPLWTGNSELLNYRLILILGLNYFSYSNIASSFLAVTGLFQVVNTTTWLKETLDLHTYFPCSVNSSQAAGRTRVKMKS